MEPSCQLSNALELGNGNDDVLLDCILVAGKTCQYSSQAEKR